MPIKYQRADAPPRELWPLYAGIEKVDRTLKAIAELKQEFDRRFAVANDDLSSELAAMQTALVEVNVLPVIHAVHAARPSRLTDPEYNALRAQLGTVRKLLGLTQAQMAKAADISHVVVQALERGRNRTTPRVLRKYVAVLVARAIARGIDPNRLPPLSTALEIVAAKRTSKGQRGERGRRPQKPIDQSQKPSPKNSSKQN